MNAFVQELLGLSPSKRKAAWRRLPASFTPDRFLRELSDAIEASRGSDREFTGQLGELTALLPREYAPEALRLKGRSLEYPPTYPEALRAYRASLRRAEEAQDALAAARVKSHLAFVLGELDRSREAEALAREAIATLGSQGEKEEQADARFRLATVLFRSGKLKEAVKALDDAEATLRNSGDRRKLARLLYTKAHYVYFLETFAQVSTWYREALALFEEFGEGEFAAITRLTLAHAALRAGRLREALKLLEEAETSCRHLKLSDRFAQCVKNRVDVLLALGRPEEALEAADQARELFEAQGNGFDAAYVAFDRAAAFAALGRYLEASRELEGAVRRFRNHPSLRLDALYQRTFLALAAGEPALALRLIKTLWKKHSKELSQPRKGWLSWVAGQAHSSLGKHWLAAASCKKATDAGRKEGLPLLHFEGLRGQAHVAQAEGRKQAALAALRQAVGILESLAIPLRDLEEYYQAFLGQRAAVYEDIVLLLLEQGTREAAEEAYAYVERAKSRQILDAVTGLIESRDDLLSRVPGEFTGKLDSLREELRRLYREEQNQSDLGEKRTSALSVALASRRQELETAYDSAWRNLTLRQPRMAAAFGALPVKVEDQAVLRDVQKSLSQGSALVEFFLARDQVLAFLVTPQDMRVIPLPDPLSHIRHSIRQWQAHIEFYERWEGRLEHFQSSQAAVARQLLHKLHEAIWAPVEAIIRANGPFPEEILLIPHGPLHQIPFSLLHDGEHFLGDEVDLLVVPSAAVGLHLGEAPAPELRKVLVVMGPPDEATPTIPEEARAVVALFPDAVVLRDDQATVAQFRREAVGAGLVHIVSHSRHREEAPLYSYVTLSGDRLTAHDLYQLPLPGALVVLSTCEGGRITVGGGDEWLGLVRGFLYAGASGLILSRWKVHDSATTALMKQFYWHYREKGIHYGKALRIAQQEIRDHYEHPYYWGAFFAVGSPSGMRSRDSFSLRKKEEVVVSILL